MECKYTISDAVLVQRRSAAASSSLKKTRAARANGAIGGASSTEAKAAAARANGKKGGRRPTPLDVRTTSRPAGK